jgi:tetrahydromethanopterin S-methyltransferase subunit G
MAQVAQLQPRKSAADQDEITALRLRNDELARRVERLEAEIRTLFTIVIGPYMPE